MAELKKAQSLGETPTKSYPFNAQANRAPFFGGESVGENPSPTTSNPFESPIPATLGESVGGNPSPTTSNPFENPIPPAQNPVKEQPNKNSVEL